MSFTPSQTRLLRALAVANGAHNAHKSTETLDALNIAAEACAPFAFIRDGVVVCAETTRVCINRGTCMSPQFVYEPTGEHVEWHDDDSPSRWQPTVPQWDLPTSPARSPRGDRSPTDVSYTPTAQDSPCGDEPVRPCYTPTAPDSPPTDERAAKRPRVAKLGWLDSTPAPSSDTFSCPHGAICF